MGKIKKIFGFLLGLLILLGMFYYIGIEKIISIILRLDVKYIIAAIFLQILVLVILSYRWIYLFRGLGYSPKFVNVFLTVLFGQFINNLTPSMRGGGEVFRAYYLSKLEDIPKGIAYSTVFVERFLDTAIFLIASFLVIIYFLLNGFKYLKFLMYSWIFILVLSLTILYILLNRNLLLKISLTIYNFACKYTTLVYDEERIKKIVDDFYNGINFLKKNKHKLELYISLFLSVLWYVVDIFKMYLYFLAIPYYVKFVVVATVYLLVLLTGVISVTPAGLGSADAVMIAGFSAFNIPTDVAAVINILDRFISYIIPTLLGYISYIIIKQKLSK
ncbi:flippase-like domain-containing protein [Methanocaldococcus indicus]|uniref:flippase-like domain-containing protein n=1 Tax=Methanocaldococcus indicus TaxID=213231 RepID=UPI003C6D3E9C